MKTKVLLTVTVMCIFSFMAVAQIKKGATFLGGQIRFSSSTVKNEVMSSNGDESLTGFTFSPAFGKAVKDNLIVGAQLLYSYSNAETKYSYMSQSRYYGTGLFVRKYKELGKSFFLFGEANVLGYFIDRTYHTDYAPGNGSRSTGYTFQMGLNAGVAFSATKRIQLEAGLSNIGFVQYTREREVFRNAALSPRTRKGISLGSNLSNSELINLGFRVLLN